MFCRLLGVRVTVRLFAGLRERAGWSQREIDADRVGDVWGALDLGDEPEGLLYAVNKEYAPVDTELRDGAHDFVNGLGARAAANAR